MKRITFPLFMVLSFILFINSTKIPTVKISNDYAMTAKLNGEFYEMNNMFGFNEATQPDINFYLSDNFIELRGRKKHKNGVFEIYLWIDKNDLKVGTYKLDSNAMNTTQKTHAGLVFNSNITKLNGVYRKTISGSITITHLDTVNKTIQGTFAFNATPNKHETKLPHFEITEGTFNYVYDIMDNSLDF